MQRASQLFSEEQRKRVDEVVAEAEAKTAAEIVPVVATVSGRYDRAEDIAGLWVAVAGLILVWWLLPDAAEEAGSWGGTSPFFEIASLVAATIAGFIVGASLSSYIHPLRRLFTPRRQMHDEVEGRARQVFFDSSVHHTAGGTGLLVYVSLYERMAAVLADRKIIEKLGDGEIDGMCRRLTASLRDGDFTKALCETLESAGERLAAAIPREEGDTNELADHLVTLD